MITFFKFLFFGSIFLLRVSWIAVAAVLRCVLIMLLLMTGTLRL